MARVFVSHAGQDRELAGRVFGWLSHDGHELFFDQDLRSGLLVGDRWGPRLFERLRWCDAVVCLVTSAYLASVWCTAELTTALNRGNLVLPLVAETGIGHPLLSGIQHADYVKNPELARALVGEALRRLDDAGGRGWPDGRSPFPGLRPFSTDLHRAFFGRRDEARKLAQLLRSPSERADHDVLLVVGPSGCGKSSLVRAGLLPLMAGESGWQTLDAILPGADPVAALARAIAAKARRLDLGWELPEVSNRLDRAGPVGVMEDLLLAGPERPQPRRVLIVVDQLEELLTLTPAVERARFAELLRAATLGPAHVVATIRPEFLTHLLGSPEMFGLPIRSFTVRPLSSQGLVDVIRRPAELAGFGVDPELVSRLVTDTGGGQALPLLAFTLQQLATDVDRGGRLSVARYEQLGGVQGALTSQADAALADAMAATGRTPEQVVAGLLRLVSVDEQGRPSRARVPLDELPETRRAELAAFTERRLLTTDTEAGTVVIGVAHEAFLTAWPPFATAITGAASALRSRRAVEQAAAEWDASGRQHDRLWERGRLAAAVNELEDPRQADVREPPAQPGDRGWRRAGWLRWIPRRRTLRATTVELSGRAREFLLTSIRSDRRRRARATTVLSALLVVAVVAAAAAYSQQQAARAQEEFATEQQKAATAQSLLAQADGIRGADPRTALELGLAADRIHPDSHSAGGLTNAVLASRLSYSLTGHDDLVTAVAFSPDGRTLATGSADDTVILWDLTGGRPEPIGHRLTGYTADVMTVAFSPDGHLLATGSSDAVTLWDVSDPTEPRHIGEPWTGHADAVLSVAFSPDGHILATGSADHTAILWDVTDPARPGRISDLTGHTDRVVSVAFSPDGRTLATGSWDSTAILWDVTDPARPGRISDPLDVHTNQVVSLAFSPDGHTLATGSSDRTVILWNVQTPSSPTAERLTGHTDWVWSVAFSPDGQTLASAGVDKTVILWRVGGRIGPASMGPALTGHSDWVSSLAFSPAGTILASGSVDDTVLLWDVTDPARPARIGPPLIGHPDTALPTSADPNPLLSVSSVAFSPDGRTLAAGNLDATVTLWDVTDPQKPARIGQPLTAHANKVSSVAFSPDGRTLASGSDDDTVILWDVTNLAQPSRIGEPLTGPTAAVYAVAFSPDGKTLASGSLDGTVTLSDVTAAQPTRIGQILQPGHGYRDDAVWATTFSPDGHTLATGGKASSLILSNVSNPAWPSQLAEPLTGHSGPVTAVAFTPDARTLVTGSVDGTAMLWDVTDPSRPTRIGEPITGHTSGIWAVTFSPDGRTLATGSADHTVILWNLTEMLDLRDRSTAAVCTIIGHGLTPEQWAHYIPGLPYQDTCNK